MCLRRVDLSHSRVIAGNSAGNRRSRGQQQSFDAATRRTAHHLLENISLKMSYVPMYALLCMENAPITV